jgi:chloramphenicol 3-O-phosphotransferase
MNGMTELTKPRLVVLNGPPAAGKSTIAKKVLERNGAGGRCVVLEYDMFADAAGRLVAPHGEIGTRIWKAALPAVIAAARAYLQSGFSVLIVMTYERRIRGKLERLLSVEEPLFVTLMPSWEASEERRRSRVHNAKELEEFDWDSHRQFYDELVDMAKAGEFDDVIDTSEMDIDTAADRIAEHLGLRS